MTPALYFLRSSESKIVQDMTKYAHKQADNLNIYYNFYGLSSKDLGLYALVDNTIAGAIWSRILGEEKHPTLSIAILPEFRSQKIASAMMHQFLIEAAAVHEQLTIQSYKNEHLVQLLINFGFTKVENSSLMIKILEKKEITRPSDGYDPRRWMD